MMSHSSAEVKTTELDLSIYKSFDRDHHHYHHLDFKKLINFSYKSELLKLHIILLICTNKYCKLWANFNDYSRVDNSDYTWCY